MYHLWGYDLKYKKNPQYDVTSNMVMYNYVAETGKNVMQSPCRERCLNDDLCAVASSPSRNYVAFDKQKTCTYHAGDGILTGWYGEPSVGFEKECGPYSKPGM